MRAKDFFNAQFASTKHRMPKMNEQKEGALQNTQDSFFYTNPVALNIGIRIIYN